MGKSVGGEDDGWKRPSGRSPWLRAIRDGASGLKRGAGSEKPGSSVRTAEMLGAPGRAGAAHIVLFRAVGVERLGDELAPEGAEFCQRFCQAVAAVRRGVKGYRTHHSHDAGPLFTRGVRRVKRLSWRWE